jgi:hypothetical protein
MTASSEQDGKKNGNRLGTGVEDSPDLACLKA